MTTKLHKFSFVSGAILGLLAVFIGAFGAHGLEALLNENGRLHTFETGSHYHFFHALALLVISLVNPPEHLVKTLSFAAICLTMGVVIFSGSLYVLAMTNMAFLGAFAPIGGSLFLIAWALLIKLGLEWPDD